MSDHRYRMRMPLRCKGSDDGPVDCSLMRALPAGTIILSADLKGSFPHLLVSVPGVTDFESAEAWIAAGDRGVA